MKWHDLMGPLVDTQPAFDALVCLHAKDTPPEAKAFTRWKLQRAIKDLRETAAHIEKRLKEEQ